MSLNHSLNGFGDLSEHVPYLCGFQSQTLEGFKGLPRKWTIIKSGEGCGNDGGNETGGKGAGHNL